MIVERRRRARRAARVARRRSPTRSSTGSRRFARRREHLRAAGRYTVLPGRCLPRNSSRAPRLGRHLYASTSEGMSLLERGDFAQATVPLARPPGWRPRRPRSARRSAAPTSAPAATPRRRAEFEAVVERYPVNDYAHFCLGRALTLTRRARPGPPAPRARRQPAARAARLPDLPRAAAPAPLGWREGAGPARQPGVGLGRRRARSRRSARGCWCCSASPRDDAEARPTGSPTRCGRCGSSTTPTGRMNEPLGDREVLCVSQFTLYGDTRRATGPSFTARGAGRGRRAAVRALLRAARRQARGASAPGWRSSWSTTGPVTLMLEA